MLGGFYYLLRSWYGSGDVLVPIGVILIGLALFSYRLVQRRKSKPKIFLDEKQKDRHVHKVDKEINGVDKWYEKYKR